MERAPIDRKLIPNIDLFDEVIDELDLQWTMIEPSISKTAHTTMTFPDRGPCVFLTGEPCWQCVPLRCVLPSSLRGFWAQNIHSRSRFSYFPINNPHQTSLDRFPDVEFQPSLLVDQCKSKQR
uniref:Uncharacterized protein n=1 Tax=Panagrellus redivivus TaxID=6233 RepID=A0A7E4URT2_PANRE